jgi:NAD-dependent SIR2 family protein deacetylase
MPDDDSIKRAATLIKQADALLITAGAGMGVDSGLPDFRGTEGFWKAYPPIAKLGKSFVEMANPEWFHIKPELGWAFYGHRLNLYRRTEPHPGFHQLLAMAAARPAGYFVFTSNVDGHFQKAGYDPERIEECHGSIRYFQCAGPCCHDIWDASTIEVRVDEDVFEAREPLPRCSSCGGVARPNILMFGDWSWLSARSQEQSERLSHWLDTCSRNARLAIVEIGAGTAVATVRRQSEWIARRFQANLIRINPRDHQLPPGPHVALTTGGAQGINSLMEAYHSLDE